MRNYRSSAGSQVRIDYGIALVRGLSNFDETREQGTAFKVLNDELDAAYTSRIALRRPWLAARQDVRFGDYNADVAIRSFQRVTEVADGGRRGPLSQALLPDGVSPVVAPSGAGQLPALVSLIDRVTNSRAAGVDAVRDAELPKLTAARTQLEAAVAAYKSARDAYNAAFSAERAIRDEHRLAVDALMGTVRSRFPGDKQRQDVIFPDVAVSSGSDGGEDTDTDSDPVPVAG